MSREWTEEQRAAFSLRNKNLLVSAAAGSGKTAVLVERIIRMVCDAAHPIDIDNLLVVTFTKAAAREMKERIRTALSEAAEQPDAPAHILVQKTLVSQAPIMTIDGFCLDVLRNHFYEIGIDPSFRTGDENEMTILQNEVLEKMLRDEYETGIPAFLDLAGLYLRKGKDERLQEMIRALHSVAESYPYPKKWLLSLSEIYSDVLRDSNLNLENLPWLAEFEEMLRKQLTEIRAEYEDLLSYCEQAGDAGVSRSAEIVKADLIIVENLLNTVDYETLVNVSEDAVASGFTRWTVRSRSGEDPDALQNVKERRTELVNLVKKKILPRCNGQGREEIVRALVMTAPHAGELVRLTLRFIDEYAAVKREKNLIDFSDQEHLALSILVDEKTGEPTAVAKEYRERFAEIIVDEYQDSNFVQETILCAISKIPAGGQNYFNVGDVKQSIYRFRMARPELFMEKHERYAAYGAEVPTDEVDDFGEDDEGALRGSVDAGAVSGVRVDLNRNFRSRAEVLDFVNDLFFELMHRDLGGITYTDDEALHLGNLAYLSAGDNDTSAQRANTGERAGNGDTAVSRDAYVPEILLCEKNADEDVLDELDLANADALEARMLAIRIKELKNDLTIYDDEIKANRPVRYADMVILLRNVKNRAEVFREALSNMNIPVSVQQSTGYFNALEVTTVLSFLRILDNGNQDIPLVSVLRSPMFSFTDEELLSIRDAGVAEHHRPYYEAFYGVAGVENDKISVELREKIYHFMQVYASLRDYARDTSIRELLQRIFAETGYLNYVSALPDGRQRRANLLKLCDMAVAFEKTSFKGLFRFVNFIEQMEKYEVDLGGAEMLSEADDAVRIMSMHKSKGLEFPVVFVAGLGGDITSNRASDITIHQTHGFAIDCVDKDLRVRYPNPYRDILKILNERDERGEEIRVLYVALTRAKEKLILTGSLKDADEVLATLRERERELSYTERISAKTYLDWILPVAARQKHPVSIRQFHAEDAALVDIIEENKKNQIKNKFLQTVKNVNKDGGKTEEKILNPYFIYKHTRRIDLKNKYSVSEIKHRAMERVQNREDAEEWSGIPNANGQAFEYTAASAAQGEQTTKDTVPAFEPTIPRFISGTETVNRGALRGTAMHRYMECFDFTVPNLAESFAMQRKQMKESGKLTDEQDALLVPEKLLAFLQSDLAKRMQIAALNGTLYVERAFVSGQTAEELFPEEYKNDIPETTAQGKQTEQDGKNTTPENARLLLVQGIIDAFFEEEGKFVLVDYKTDRVKTKDYLAALYKRQMELYASAISRAYGKPVGECYLYSFALNVAVEVPLKIHPCQ